MLGENRYGKSGIRLAKLTRNGNQHDFRDITVAVELEGDFEAAHLAGDNSAILPTDTMKNTVYAFAKEGRWKEIEELGILLAGHFLKASPAASLARIRMKERLWERVAVGAKPHGTTFRAAGGESRLATVEAGRETLAVESGLENLLVAKTAQSGFSGFLRDGYTTLKETEDRILATEVKATWSYAGNNVAYGPSWRGIRQTLLETFAEHDSASVQHTLYAMGEAVLERHAAVREIRLAMPNKHHLLVDLAPFGLENRNEIFVPTEEPYGLIEATVVRRSLKTES